MTWDWRATDPSGAGRRDERASLRRAAVIQTAVMALFGVALHVLLGHVLFARVVWGLAALILALGLCAPRAYRPVHGFGRLLGRVVGRVLLYLLLVPLYFILFAPVALILRLRRCDPLQRRYRAADETYWIPRRPKARDANIDDQFLREDRDARELRRPVGGGRAAEGGGP